MSTPVRIAAAYAVFATLWIYYSDHALAALVPDPVQLVRWSVYKGLAFVVITAVLLLLLMQRAFGATEAGYQALRQHKADIERFNRLYAALSQVNQAIVWSATREELFDKVCRTLVDDGGFRMVWFGWHDEATSTLRPVASWGHGTDYLEGITVRVDDQAEGRGPSGTAFREDRTFVCNDLLNDPVMLPWRQRAAERGYRASAAFPVHLAGRPAGMLSVYAEEAGFFQDREIALLVEAALDVSFGLDNFAREEARQRTQAALQESEQRFRQVVENIHEVFWITDPHQCLLLYVSPAYERIWGRSCASLHASPASWLDAVDPRDKERVLAAMELQSSGGYDQTYRVLRPDGTVRWVHDRAAPVLDAQGVPYRVVGIAEDVTERLNLEDNLRQAQRLDSLGQLTGGVAHDFNNLLTVILGNAELLQERLAADAKLAPLAQLVVQAAERGADLTQRLLAFARKQALEPQVVDVNARVAGMDALVRRSVGEAIQIEFHPGADLWPALVDPAQLDNALLNLCLNARDAMPHGGQVTISTANVELRSDDVQAHLDLPAGSYVLLSVADTGTGIAPEQLDRVFEPFFTTKERTKGTGLGLAMVYGFMKQSGGHAAIASAPGAGTSVNLYLPRALGATPVPAPAADLSAPEGGSETILLVEDDALVRRYAQEQLVSLGYRVVQAPDGDSALALLRSMLPVDLLFTDVMMPGTGGPALAQQALAMRPALKVLYTSGYTEQGPSAEGALAPGPHFLPKPYRRDELARALRLVLK